jgi:hypothetical protein
MKKRFLTIGVAFALLALGSATRAQSPWQVAQETAVSGDKAALQGFLEQSRRRGASPEFVQEVLGEARRMEARGLPSGPYLLKASEGLAKGVEPTRMRPALGETERRIQTADDLVKRAVSRGATVRSPEDRREATLRMQRALLNQVSPRALERLGDAMTAKPGRVDVGQIGEAASELSRKQYSNRPKGSEKSGWWGSWKKDSDRDGDHERDRKKDQEKRKEKKAKELGSGDKGEKKEDGGAWKRKSGDDKGPKWKSSPEGGQGNSSGKGGSSGFGGSGKGKGKK